MSDQRAAKLARLDRVRRACPHITESALEAVLKLVAAEGVPELRCRKHLAAARAELLQRPTPYGPLHVSLAVEGGCTRVEAIDPKAMSRAEL